MGGFPFLPLFFFFFFCKLRSPFCLTLRYLNAWNRLGKLEFKIIIHAISFQYLRVITICLCIKQALRGNTHLKVPEYYFTSFSGHSPVQ